MALYSDIIAEARVLLQDTSAPYRNSDIDLLVGANDAVKTIRKVRPDIFYGTYKTSIADAALSSAFPLGDEYKMAVRNYIVAQGDLRDAEDASTGRAALFMGLFEKSVSVL